MLKGNSLSKAIKSSRCYLSARSDWQLKADIFRDRLHQRHKFARICQIAPKSTSARVDRSPHFQISSWSCLLPTQRGIGCPPRYKARQYSHWRRHAYGKAYWLWILRAYDHPKPKIKSFLRHSVLHGSWDHQKNGLWRKTSWYLGARSSTLRDADWHFSL